MFESLSHENDCTPLPIRMQAKITIRLALPPKVSSLIASQRDALTKRRRSISSKRVMKERMKGGWVPNFKKGRAKKVA